jgi:hypothetical protein
VVAVDDPGAGTAASRGAGGVPAAESVSTRVSGAEVAAEPTTGAPRRRAGRGRGGPKSSSATATPKTTVTSSG